MSRVVYVTAILMGVFWFGLWSGGHTVETYFTKSCLLYGKVQAAGVEFECSKKHDRNAKLAWGK